MRTLLIGGALLGFAAAAAAGVADSAWNGHWKLDPAKSNFTGNTFTYTMAPKGLIHFSDGSTTSYDFGQDGKEYPTTGNRTTLWTAAGANAWDQVTRADGKVIATSHRVLSKDGKTLTMTFSGTQPDGTAFKDEEVYTRVSGMDGLIGKWRSIKSGPNAPLAFVISAPKPGTLHFEVPDQKMTVEGVTDGTDYPLSGPTSSPGMTIAFNASGREIRYTIKMNGKPDAMGIQTLSSDNRSFTDVSWAPGKESEKQTAVYLKQ